MILIKFDFTLVININVHKILPVEIFNYQQSNNYESG